MKDYDKYDSESNHINSLKVETLADEPRMSPKPNNVSSEKPLVAQRL
jgi:hypothetical protein